MLIGEAVTSAVHLYGGLESSTEGKSLLSKRGSVPYDKWKVNPWVTITKTSLDEVGVVAGGIADMITQEMPSSPGLLAACKHHMDGGSKMKELRKEVSHDLQRMAEAEKRVSSARVGTVTPATFNIVAMDF